MNGALGKCFAQAQTRGRAAFIPYATGGFPSPELCQEIILAYDQAGAEVIEIGLPFSDPVADGPVIQSASFQALQAGATPLGVLRMLAGVRARVKAQVVLMSYYNPVRACGLDEFASRARDSGASGVIIPDLPPEEAAPWVEAARKRGLDTIFMVAPTTPRDRLDFILSVCRGFLYYVSQTGVTGSGLQVGDELREGLTQVREASPWPVAVGFGVATPQQGQALAPLADGVVVGSALVKTVLEAASPEQGLERAAALARELSASLQR